jgi:hypothetical protein
MTKRIVLAFGLEKVQIDPQFCDHQNVELQGVYPETGERFYSCLDCGALIDQEGEVVRVTNEIPVWKGKL